MILPQPPIIIKISFNSIEGRWLR